MNWLRGYWMESLFVFVVTAFVALIAWAAVADSGKRSDCVRQGGRLVEGPCTTVYIGHNVGNVHWMQPIESCEWRCDMPERERP